MNPSVWGPKLWFSLHTITLNYPKKPTYKDKKITQKEKDSFIKKKFKSLFE